MTLTFVDDSKTAYLFPGQGAQAVGMGLELFEKSIRKRDRNRSKTLFGNTPRLRNHAHLGARSALSLSTALSAITSRYDLLSKSKFQKTF